VSALIEPVAKLIEALSRLPGIGPKTAQRLTYHILRAPDSEARLLAAALIAIREEVMYCESCFNISTGPLCPICADPSRDQTRLCVVEEPLDVLAIERTSRAPRRDLTHGRYRPRQAQGARAPGKGI
jgi:recombination protein RecR